jgi:cell volume regulation protein A
MANFKLHYWIISRVRGVLALDPVVLAFVVAGTIIILGFLGEEFFKRTSIPDPILLLLFGVLLGPVFNVFSHEQLVSITPYFAALALIMILFDGGLNMKIQEAMRNSPRALVLRLFGLDNKRLGHCLALQVRTGLAPLERVAVGEYSWRRQFNHRHCACEKTWSG